MWCSFMWSQNLSTTLENYKSTKSKSTNRNGAPINSPLAGENQHRVVEDPNIPKPVSGRRLWKFWTNMCLIWGLNCVLKLAGSFCFKSCLSVPWHTCPVNGAVSSGLGTDLIWLEQPDVCKAKREYSCPCLIKCTSESYWVQYLKMFSIC